ncbi:MAG: hypothetical protein IMF11_21375, partial [Proteobacteria bacterium]|nr:hypothetical protein [Pseudomonadota bacterium]
QELNHTFKLAKKVGLKAEYSFMVNAPGETIFTLFENLFFIIKAKLELGKGFMPHNLLMTTPIRIYPHTEIRDLAIKEGLIKEDDDLIDPIFYNPAPLKYVVSMIAFCSRIAWWMKSILTDRD